MMPRPMISFIKSCCYGVRPCPPVCVHARPCGPSALTNEPYRAFMWNTKTNPEAEASCYENGLISKPQSTYTPQPRVDSVRGQSPDVTILVLISWYTWLLFGWRLHFDGD